MLKSPLTRFFWLSLLLFSACAGNAPRATVAPVIDDPTALPAQADEAAAPEQTASAPGSTTDEGAGSDHSAAEGEDSEIEEPAADADNENAVAATPGPPQNIHIVAPDGLMLQGTFYPAAGDGPWPAVLLLHMLGSDRDAWTATSLPEALAAAGYAALALDMRGHGDTGGASDWLATEEDLLKIWSYLAEREDVDDRRIAVVGASIGANMALRAGAREAFIPTAILLSPGLDYQGVTTEDALVGYGGRPLLIVASSEDGYAANSSRTLAGLAGESAQLLMYDGAGHGTNMFSREPDLIIAILDWLGGNL